MARHFVALGAVGLVLLLSSCGEPKVYMDVLEGNYAFSGGDYMSANMDYLRAEREGLFLPRIHYNLGNVYHALGESFAALEEWDRAGDTGDEMLMYRIAFNSGVLYYGQGEYQAAYRSFRRALRFRPDDIQAKVNLEHALRKQALEEGEQKPQPSDTEEETEVSGDGKRILEYVQRSTPTKLVPEDEPMKEKEVKDW